MPRQERFFAHSKVCPMAGCGPPAPGEAPPVLARPAPAPQGCCGQRVRGQGQSGEARGRLGARLGCSGCCTPALPPLSLGRAVGKQEICCSLMHAKPLHYSSAGSLALLCCHCHLIPPFSAGSWPGCQAPAGPRH